MSKKILSLLMGLVVVTSLVGCKSAAENAEKKTETKTVESTDSSDQNLEGKWAKNYTLDQTQKVFKDKLSKMENITKDLGVKYTKDEKIKKEKDENIDDNFIYFDNKSPEANKIESMYFGMKTYGDNLETGDISLELSLNFDGDAAIKDNNFDLGKTSFKKYIEAFTDQENRDYSDINKEIISKLKNGDKQVDIKDTVDGLKEEIIATKECIIYKLSTKKYKFADGEMSMK
ncbi:MULTISPECIES: hypothetical protein [unclassified Clostridium]|uniref:hypothetical protein n=1 Tax=unclassified Clostridium TaxID=2614128 RepID=UPI000297C66E|nr:MULTISPECIES: hypothetical protein [unclassified Clostridium]EKQ55130.1 MAG: hypothetical protein A370_02904 [Clostridium sp. Maddingley MBC34-26]